MFKVVSKKCLDIVLIITLIYATQDCWVCHSLIYRCKQLIKIQLTSDNSLRQLIKNLKVKGR